MTRFAHVTLCLRQMEEVCPIHFTDPGKGTSMSTQRPMPATPKEQDDVDTLIAMMGGAVESEVALNILRHHNGDVYKAASTLLENGDEFSSGGTFPDIPMDTGDAGTSGPRTPPPSKPERSSPVIDLTAEGEENLSRAMQASLEGHEPAFGPSTRAPDPSWAMVPSNVEVGTSTGVSHDDQSLSRAIEASLQSNINDETFEELPLEERIRQGGRPVALRPTLSTLTYAGLLLHGLFHVPQIRHQIALWRPKLDPDQETAEEVSPPTSGPGFMIWSLLEIFVNMDLALLSELSVDAAIDAFTADHWNSPAERPGDMTYPNSHGRSKRPCMRRLQTNHSIPRGTGMRSHTSSDGIDSPPIPQTLPLPVRLQRRRPQPGAIRPADRPVCGEGGHPRNGGHKRLGLLPLLGARPPRGGPAKQQVIFEPSDVVAFQLVRHPPAAGTRAEVQTFGYPKHVYLDQYLAENVQLANTRRAQQKELYAEVEGLLARRRALMRHDVRIMHPAVHVRRSNTVQERDVLEDLQSVIYYYEHVAESNGDAERDSEIKNHPEKLRKIVERIEGELMAIDSKVGELRADAAKVLECPELQKHRYDLRVVLVHDGQYGRNHLYSYVKQRGTWWKTVDYTVTEVTEELVLTDPVGLLYEAGPYFLIYSRALSEEDEGVRAPWPEDVKDAVKHNNKIFLSQLPPDIATRVVDPNSPPSSPYMSATPSEYTISSVTAEPALSRDESMDTAE
ncbi:hypothetical protein A0H81_13252 [Grifola frondosa]|uniref:Peptidase C19 ubiquitin carboxyl-terminal hydrolase domain-containing protein n=1 Tax=Grifola frondosa TaxID=5627 RepID=A0A1C7LVS8_GRIFR|nr:hypothetical protein A0H81_13252 [Grifola frondosa]